MVSLVWILINQTSRAGIIRTNDDEVNRKGSRGNGRRLCPREYRRRSGMSWEYEGLFDAELNDEPRLWRTEPVEGTVGRMQYRTKTT